MPQYCTEVRGCVDHVVGEIKDIRVKSGLGLGAIGLDCSWGLRIYVGGDGRWG